jgi:hypothetical protein
MDFVIGGVTAVIAIFGYWTILALYDWIDMRPARRLRRATAHGGKV